MHSGSLPLALQALGQSGGSLAQWHADYIGVALAAMVSWIGLVGAGEAALIAAGVAAAHHRVDLESMIAVAWLGAAAGGATGYALGLKGGRALLTRPGPLLAARRALLRNGDAIYARGGVVAVFLSPSWMAGIGGMRARLFVPANLLASLTWAVGIGAGAYAAGPAVAGVVDDIGTAWLVVVAALVLVASLMALVRRVR